MAIKKQITTNDPFEALFLKQADASATMTVDNTGALIEWAFSESDKISKAAAEIASGSAAIKIDDASELLKRELGVVLTFYGREAERSAPRERGKRTAFTDEMKREALALKDQGMKVSDIQRQLEAKFGGPAYQTLIKFLNDVGKKPGRR